MLIEIPYTYEVMAKPPRSKNYSRYSVQASCYTDIPEFNAHRVLTFTANKHLDDEYIAEVFFVHGKFFQNIPSNKSNYVAAVQAQNTELINRYFNLFYSDSDVKLEDIRGRELIHEDKSEKEKIAIASFDDIAIINGLPCRLIEEPTLRRDRNHIFIAPPSINTFNVNELNSLSEKTARQHGTYEHDDINVIDPAVFLHDRELERFKYYFDIYIEHIISGRENISQFTLPMFSLFTGLREAHKSIVKQTDSTGRVKIDDSSIDIGVIGPKVIELFNLHMQNDMYTPSSISSAKSAFETYSDNLESNSIPTSIRF